MRPLAASRSALPLGRCLVASLALHGLVLAAALEIPWERVEASAARRAAGDGFALSLRLAELGPSAPPSDVDVLPPNPVALANAPQGAPSGDTDAANDSEPETTEASTEPPVFELELPFGLAATLPTERTAEPAHEREPASAPVAPLEPRESRESGAQPTNGAEAAASDSESSAPPASPTGPPQSGTAPSEHAVFLDGPDPVYPRLSVRAGEEGVVVCRLALDAGGRVERVSVIASSGHARLDRAAVDALSRWRFAAVPREGAAVPREVVHRVVFRLSGAR